jgi:hypothetical protein
LGKNTRHRSVKCFPPRRSWLRPFRKVGVILNTVAFNVLAPFHTQTLTEVLAAQVMRPSCKAAAIGCSAPESARAHSIPTCSGVVGRLVLACQPTGPARALTDPLRQERPVADLMDGLPTLTRIRLSRLSADSDAMRIGVIFTRTATVPILSKSLGRHGPQSWVGKSMRVCCRPGRSLALPAKKET